jgi:hypothetical protein
LSSILRYPALTSAKRLSHAAGTATAEDSLPALSVL